MAYIVPEQSSDLQPQYQSEHPADVCAINQPLVEPNFHPKYYTFSISVRLAIRLAIVLAIDISIEYAVLRPIVLSIPSTIFITYDSPHFIS